MRGKLELILGIILFACALYFLFYSFWSFNTIGEVGNSAIMMTIISAVAVLLFFIVGFKLFLSYFKNKNID